MQDKHNSLTSEVFEARIKESFPGVYLTTTSIIQGVGLGLLLTNTFSYINCSDLSAHWLRFLPYSILSFLVLIIVTFEYSWFVGIFRFSPRLVDIIIPFVLGVAEISPMFYLTNPKVWWLLISTFCFIGAIGFFNSVFMCKKYITDPIVNKLIGNTLKYNILISVSVAIISMLAGLIHYWQQQMIISWYIEAIFWSFIFLPGFIMLFKDEHFMTKLHEHYEVER